MADYGKFLGNILKNQYIEWEKLTNWPVYQSSPIWQPSENYMSSQIGKSGPYMPIWPDPDRTILVYWGKDYKDVIIAPEDVVYPEKLAPLERYDRRYLKKLGRKASEKLGYIPHRKRAFVIRAEVNFGTRNCNNLRFWAGLPMCRYTFKHEESIMLEYDPKGLA
jgi:hypothetical protein